MYIFIYAANILTRCALLDIDSDNIVRCESETGLLMMYDSVLYDSSWMPDVCHSNTKVWSRDILRNAVMSIVYVSEQGYITV